MKHSLGISFHKINSTVHNTDINECELVLVC
jgi:hypothetical protein